MTVFTRVDTGPNPEVSRETPYR